MSLPLQFGGSRALLVSSRMVISRALWWIGASFCILFFLLVSPIVGFIPAGFSQSGDLVPATRSDGLRWWVNKLVVFSCCVFGSRLFVLLGLQPAHRGCEDSPVWLFDSLPVFCFSRPKPAVSSGVCLRVASYVCGCEPVYRVMNTQVWPFGIADPCFKFHIRLF